MRTVEQVIDALENVPLSSALYIMEEYAMEQGEFVLAQWCLNERKGYKEEMINEEHGYRSTPVEWQDQNGYHVVIPDPYKAALYSTLPILEGVQDLEAYVDAGKTIPMPQYQTKFNADPPVFSVNISAPSLKSLLTRIGFEARTRLRHFVETHPLMSPVRQFSDNLYVSDSPNIASLENVAVTEYGGRWKVIRPIGSGGQGQAFIVEDLKDTNNNRYVLKRLKDKQDPKALHRFGQEIQAIKMLDHPNILKLEDADVSGEEPYSVSEYCSGGNLAELMEKNGRLDLDRSFQIFLEVCNGLKTAHDNKPVVVHRDIKPENILLRTPDGPAVIGDFGICHMEGNARVTTLHEKVGPRYFVAPELRDGRLEDVKPVCDVYSLGKLLYWLLSGGDAFDREDQRDKRYDLRLLMDDDRMEHANRFFDRTIVLDPEKRLTDAGLVEQEARIIYRLLNGRFNAVSPNIKQYCTYCGEGIYKHIVRGRTTDVANFGITPVGSAEWRIMVCTDCGHVQMFRKDFATRREWWEEGNPA